MEVLSAVKIRDHRLSFNLAFLEYISLQKVSGDGRVRRYITLQKYIGRWLGGLDS
jgi:hypothetical protein